MPLEDTPSSSDAIATLKQGLSCLETEMGRLKGVNFKPRPDDVFIVTPPKCGTTWVQQIMHSLRSRGDMSFDEISLVIPCLEMASDSGVQDLDAPQPGAPPRCYKTHFWWRECPKGARYIYVVRDPVDAGPSFFHFFNGWMFDEGEIKMDEFLEEFWLRRGAPATPMQNASHWHNMASWFPHRNDPNVMWLHYEDLVAAPEACVRLIARFMPGVDETDEALIATALEQSSITYMRQHPTKYDEHHLKLARNEACGRPRTAGLSHEYDEPSGSGGSSGGGDGGSGMSGSGGGGDGSGVSSHIGGGGSAPLRACRNSGKVRAEDIEKQRPSERVLAAIQARWTEVMEPVTGYRSYAEMRDGINRELGRPF